MSLCRFISLTEINKGWSGDKKYRAVDETGKVFLLRVTNSARGERYADIFRSRTGVEHNWFCRADFPDNCSSFLDNINI